MPIRMALAGAALGAAYGLLPIGWIVLNVVFLYQIVERRGLLRLAPPRRRGHHRRPPAPAPAGRLLLWSLHGRGGRLRHAGGRHRRNPDRPGLRPLEASGLSLIANTAPVAFGALGTPIVALQGVTGIDLRALSAQVGHQLPVFSVIVPFWLMWAYAGWRGMLEVWPAGAARGCPSRFPSF